MAHLRRCCLLALLFALRRQFAATPLVVNGRFAPGSLTMACRTTR